MFSLSLSLSLAVYSTHVKLQATLTNIATRVADPVAMKDLLQKVMSIGHLQRGHSLKTALTRYGISDLNLQHVDSFLMACCFNYSQEWFDYFVHGINIPVLDDVAVPTIESRNVAVQPSLPVQNPSDIDSLTQGRGRITEKAPGISN